jgi:hypothetical protein
VNKGTFWKIFIVTAVLIIGAASVRYRTNQQKNQEVISDVKIAFEGIDLESAIQKSVQQNPRFSEIQNGVYKWKVEKYGVVGGAYLVKYGYWGQDPKWKTVLGNVIQAVTFVCTLTYHPVNPWPADREEVAIFYIFQIDYNNQSLDLLYEVGQPIAPEILNYGE